MATLIKISDTVNWVRAYGWWKPLSIGTGQEPALTIANTIIQTILGPPFCWAWNRNSYTFLTEIGVQDYTKSIPDFGFLEKASYIPATTVTATALTSNVATYTAVNSFEVGDKVTVTGTTNGSGIFNVTRRPITAVTSTSFSIALVHSDILSAVDNGTALGGDNIEISNVMNVLGVGSETGPPDHISTQTDLNDGTFEFRLLPVPDKVYQITLTYQKRVPSTINSLSKTWAPIPDRYAYIYNLGFLALAMAYWQDPRWTAFNTKFVSALLGAAEGLSETHKNLFMDNWLATIAEQQAAVIKTTQGNQARST